MINYGEELKYHREKNNLSQNKLAKETGIKQQNINRWEKGEATPNIDFCVILADYYGISLDELIGREVGSNGKYVNSFNNANISADHNSTIKF